MNRIRRRAASALGLFALLAGALSAIAPAQAADGHTVTVTVSPNAGGYGIYVQCSSGSTTTYFDSATADANGTGVFRGVPDTMSCSAVSYPGDLFFSTLVSLQAPNGDYRGGQQSFTSGTTDMAVAVTNQQNTNPRCTEPTRIAGDAAVGHPVSTTTPPVVNATVNSSSTIWYRVTYANTRVSATVVQQGHSGGGNSYTPTEADLGSQLVALSVQGVTPTGSSFSTIAICDYVPSGAVHRAGTPAPGAPGVKGKAKVGKKLTAVAPPLAGSTVGYQWIRAVKVKGKNRIVLKPIKGATGMKYKVKSKDKGKKVFVAVTYTKAPDGPTTVLSRGKKVR